MIKFRTGNVIKTARGNIKVVISVKDDGYTETIYVNAENTRAGHKYKTYTEDAGCICGFMSCPVCMGKEKNIITHYGMEDATLVARTIKDWITKTLLGKFEF